MNVSSTQKFLVTHTYKFETAFICMEYKSQKKFAHSPFLVARRKCATASCTLELDISYWQLKRAAWIWWELAWGNMQMYVKWPEREMKHCIVIFICFTEQSILSNWFIVQKNVKGGNASNCMVVLLFSDTTSKGKNRQLYLLTRRKCHLLVVGLTDTFLHE